jgi:hypothetical protein
MAFFERFSPRGVKSAKRLFAKKGTSKTFTKSKIQLFFGVLWAQFLVKQGELKKKIAISRQKLPTGLHFVGVGGAPCSRDIDTTCRRR